MRSPLPLACLALLLACAPAAAQTAAAPGSPLERGMRVRVHGPSTGRERWVGRVSAVGADTVLLYLKKHGRRSLLLSAGDRIEVSRGRGNHVGAAFLGLFAGALAGGAAGFVVGSGSADGDGLAAPAGAVMGALVGAPAGALYMGRRGFELWTRVWPAPQGGPGSTAAVGVGMTLTVR